MTLSPRTGRGPAAALVAAIAVCFAAGEAHAAWRAERFLVGGWVPGPARTAAKLIALDSLGLDYFHVDYPSAEESRTVTARLDSLAAARPGFRLQAIVHYRVPFDDPARIVDNDDPVGNWERIRPGLLPSGGMNRRSTLGWHLFDEPVDRAAMARLGEMSRRLRMLPETRDQLGFANLLPLTDPAARPGYARDYGTDPAAAYGAYLRDYLSQFDPTDEPASVLSYDHFPFLTSTRPGSNWFQGLTIARDAALEYSRPQENRNVALWVIVQCADFRPRGGTMSRHFEPAMLDWQVWSAVAYGAKGIAYWTLAPADDRDEKFGFGAGAFDAEGRRTALYPHIARLNAELHALGPVLVRLDPVAAWHAAADGQAGVEPGWWNGAGSLAELRLGVRGVAPGPGSEDALLTVFRERASGTTWVMAVNKSLAAARTFQVRLDRRPAGIERIRRSDGRAVAVAAGDGGFSTGSIPPGTGELFRLRP